MHIPNPPDARQFLQDLFGVAVAAAYPEETLPRFLPSPPPGRTVVVGAGKAAASMARAVETHWRGPLSGMVITRYQHGLDLQHIRVVEAGHPVPDNSGQKATDEILELVSDLTANDLVLCLISGGGSALLAKPAEGISLADKQAINKALLASGAPIGEMNIVRKKLSAIKGGRLAVAAWPAPVVTLLISDVPGDDPAIIASGLTIADETGVTAAREILDRYGIAVPDAVLRHLESDRAVPPPVSHPAFAAARTSMIATPQDSLQAAARLARDAGIRPLILGDSIEGEARDVALVMAGITRQVLTNDEPVRKPCVLLSGGETTVTVAPNLASPGRGGRNAEFLLAFASAMAGVSNVYAFAGDTDGIDGTEENAGALFDPTTLQRAASLGLSATEYLSRHDAHGFFEALGDLVVTGPTRTNVNDFRAILILPNETTSPSA